MYDLYKLLGDINWLHLTPGIPTYALNNLFGLLRGPPQMGSPYTLAPQAHKELEWLKRKFRTLKFNVLTPLPLQILIFPTPHSPTAVIVQQNDLVEWLFLPNNFVKSLPSYVELISELISIPPNTVGLLLGHSSLTSEGVSLHTGIIDPGYEGEIQIIMFSFVPWLAKRGKRVAQLLLINYTSPEKREHKKEEPEDLEVLVWHFFAGADVSIISSQEWPVN